MIKLRKEEGNIVLYITPMVLLHTINQWKKEAAEEISFDLINVINVYVSRDPYLDRYDLGIILLGIGLSLKINYFNSQA